MSSMGSGVPKNTSSPQPEKPAFMMPVKVFCKPAWQNAKSHIGQNSSPNGYHKLGEPIFPAVSVVQLG